MSLPALKVVRVIARLNVGGPARQCLLLDGLLRARGWEQVLATGELDAGEAGVLDREPELGRGAHVVRIPGLGRRISLADDARALGALVSLLRRERPDVVHTHTAKAGALGRVAARIARVPVVVHTFHGHVLSGYFGRVGSWLATRVERALARLADRLVVLSPLQETELADRFAVAPREKFVVVPLGRDLERFEQAGPAAGSRPTFRESLGLASETPVLAFVGRLVPIKDPRTLLEALARAKGEAAKSVLLVAGSGPLEDDVRAWARELGLEARVRLLGWRNDLDAILAASTALVLSSRNEGTPLAIIEALAAGTPVVSTAVGGVPDMLARTGGAAGDCAALERARSLGVDLRAEGALVPAGDPDRLARALELVCDDAALRARASEAGRAASKRYSAERLATDLERLYRSELAKSPRGRKALARAQRSPSSPAALAAAPQAATAP